MRNQGQTSVHQDLGTEIDIANVTYPDIRVYIRTHTATQAVCELGDPEFGWIAPIDDGACEVLDVPDAATALVEWNDGADDDPDIEIRALGPAEHITITSQATSTLVEQVLAHYETHPEDDGHPAYGLYTEWPRRKDRAAEQAADAERSAP